MKDTETLLRYSRWYLGRYPCSTARLRRKLDEKIHRDNLTCDSTDQVVAQMAAEGLLDDARYGLGVARAVLRKGQGVRAVTHTLRARGVSADSIAQVLAALEDEDPTWEHAALCRYCACRGLDVCNPKDRQTLLRRGFSSTVLHSDDA